MYARMIRLLLVATLLECLVQLHKSLNEVEIFFKLIR